MIDGVAAANWLAGYGAVPVGYCLKYVWLAYKAQGASTGMSAGTAYQAWGLSDGKRPGDRNPPPGAAVWWGRRYDGNLDGDVTISLGGGRIAATDWPTGRTGITTIDAREAQIGREYLGWTSSIFDCPISLPGVGKDAAPTSAVSTVREDIMATLIRNDDGTIFLADEYGTIDPRKLLDPNTGLQETVGALDAALGAKQLSNRQFDLVGMALTNRWTQQRAALIADITKAVVEALGKALPR